MSKTIRIGTRDSQLAVWQATHVQGLLQDHHIHSELVYIKSEGDLDTVTPLYALGVQGIFTKTLDAALLNKRIDIAVHSMKDVPVQLAEGIQQAAVLPRASHKDILVYQHHADFLEDYNSVATIATSSIRRMAQWLNRYPGHQFENLRGNVNTRLRKLTEHAWHGAIFAAAGLERIKLRPKNSIDLDWMLPAPAQGAIMVVCRQDDAMVAEYCAIFNDVDAALCTKIERDFLKELLGGCSTPISGLAYLSKGTIFFEGNIVTPDGKNKVEITRSANFEDSDHLGTTAAREIMNKGGKEIMAMVAHKNGKSSYDQV